MNCKNCNAPINGTFCQSCGQKLIDSEDRSLSKLLAELISNLFFFDGRFWISLRYLMFKPGKMTTEFVDGKRKRFLPPISLFLLVNLIYFIVSPTSDYSLSLYEQLNMQFYSDYTVQLIDHKVEESGMSYHQIESLYNKKSLGFAKLFMILNIPLIAIILYLFNFRNRKFFFDSLIFSCHFFAFFLIMTMLMHLIDWLIDASWEGIFVQAVFVITILYAILAVREFYQKKWYFYLPMGLVCFGSIAISILVYRLMNFAITYLLL